MYMGAEVGRFGFHSWVEVALGGRWVAVDPTSNEVSVNPTHITLGREGRLDWLSTLGSAALEPTKAR